MTPEIAKLLAKVASLRALAAGSKSQAEAENAARMADEILTKHRLTEAEIPTMGAEACGQSTLGEQAKCFATWRGVLAFGLAKHYGCYVHDDRTVGVYAIYGQPSDVEIVRYMYAWLGLEIDRLATREHGKAARNAFRHGATSGYLDMLRASFTKATKDHGSAALALVDRGKQAEELSRRLTGIGGPGQLNGGISDHNAYARGEAAGARLKGQGALAPAGVRGLLK